MSKNQKASGITNIINYDNSGNISFVSGSTTLMSVSSSGAVVLTGTMSGGTADSASLSANSNLLQGTGSIGFATTASLLAVSSSQQQISASLLTLTASYTALSSSYTALSGSYNTFSGSASTRVTVDSASLQQVSSSQQQISASLLNVIATYATTGSNSFRANQSITGSLVVSSTITAQTLVVQTVTSSIVYSSGSNIFGSALSNTQTFTGSIYQTGSIAAFAGSVGIGTTNPSNKLTVRGTDSTSMLYLGISGASANGEAVGITFGSATYDKARIVAYNENSGNAAGYLTLWTGGSPTTTDITERMRITSAGNIGMGTTSPNTKLQILGSTLTVGDQSTYALGIGNSSGYDLTLGTDSSYAYIQSWTSKSLSINSQGNNVLFPNSSTNIGIGTTNPITKVDVVGNSTDSVKLRVRNTNVSGSAGIVLNPEGAGAGSLGDATIFYDVNSTAWVAGVDKSDSSKFKISNDVYADFRANNFFTITTAGRVGIGVTNPTKLFEVNGRMATSATVSTNLIAGNIASNMPSSPAYIPIFNLAEAAGMSLVGFVNAASYTCFNISQIYIKKEYSGTGITAGITGLYKSACDFSIVNITYSGVTYVALRFTSNPEIDVMWTGYLLNYAFNSDGSAQVWTSGVTLNSTYATY